MSTDTTSAPTDSDYRTCLLSYAEGIECPSHVLRIMIGVLRRHDIVPHHVVNWTASETPAMGSFRLTEGRDLEWMTKGGLTSTLFDGDLDPQVLVA